MAKLVLKKIDILRLSNNHRIHFLEWKYIIFFP